MLRINKRFWQMTCSLLGACVVVYFLYHALQGDRGWFAMIRMQNEVKMAEATLEKLRAERDELRHRTELLKDKSLDPDLLEEKSRELLNYSKSNEIVILTPQDDPGAKPPPRAATQ